MDTVEDIETAVDRLSPDEYKRFVNWLREREQARWDRQLDEDSAAGKLDLLFTEAGTEFAQGLLREWPSQK